MNRNGRLISTPFCCLMLADGGLIVSVHCGPLLTFHYFIPRQASARVSATNLLIALLSTTALAIATSPSVNSSPISAGYLTHFFNYLILIVKGI
ncbi:hypothetical protein V1504DRAFT_452188 [Lipomyces starkeyi]